LLAEILKADGTTAEADMHYRRSAELGSGGR
jgi:hypothetical protein